MLIKKILSVILAVFALFIGAIGTASACPARPVSWHLATGMTEDHIAPIVTMKANVDLKEAGWALRRSDDLHPMVKDVQAGTKLQYPLMVMKCGEAALINPYAITSAGKLILGKARSLYRSCITHVGKHANEACGPTDVKELHRTITVTPGDKFSWGGMSHLAYTDGTWDYSRAFVDAGSPDMIRISYFPNGMQQVDRTHHAQSTVFVTLNYGASVVSDVVTRECHGGGFAG